MFDLSRIQDWYESEAGRLISRAVEQHVWEITACVFGYHAVQVGEAFPGRNLLRNCTIRHQIMLDRSSAANIISSPAALPISSDSIDLFVLAHTLDFTDKPHQILREVERCLVAEGYMIIIGFNPHSFYGLWRCFLAVMYQGKIVETGEALSVLRHPQHEYTKKLLAAVPRLHLH